jgi:hypothetical protein
LEKSGGKSGGRRDVPPGQTEGAALAGRPRLSLVETARFAPYNQILALTSTDGKIRRSLRQNLGVDSAPDSGTREEQKKAPLSRAGPLIQANS